MLVKDLSPYHSLHEDIQNLFPLYELKSVFSTWNYPEISAAFTPQLNTIIQVKKKEIVKYLRGS